MGFKEIGKMIQKAREERGWTQSDLAEKLNITQAALSNYELGKRRLYLSQIQKVAEILEKDLSFFIAGELSEMKPLAPQTIAQRVERVARRLERCTDGELDLVEQNLDFIEWRRKGNV